MQLIINSATGEVQAIEDGRDPLTGYGPEWSLLGTADAPPENASWDGAAWAVDPALASDKAELAEVTDRERLRQIIRNARARIVALENDVATLKNRQAQLIAAAQNHEARIAALEAK